MCLRGGATSRRQRCMELCTVHAGCASAEGASHGTAAWGRRSSGGASDLRENTGSRIIIICLRGGAIECVSPPPTPRLPLRPPSSNLQAFKTEWFDRDAKIFVSEGSISNPIPILSVEPERIVGISLPNDSEIRWFTLKEGTLAYDPDTCNFFALKVVSPEEVEAWVHIAETTVFGAKAKA